MQLQFTQDLGLWAYLLLAILVIVEGPIVTLAGAVAASSGLMKPELVFLSAATGNLIADTLWYTVGYLGKMEWLHRYGGWFGVRESYVQRFNRDIQAHAAKLLFIAKLTLGFSIPTLIATGLSRVPVRRWFFVLVIGETLWTGSLVVLGMYFGKYVQQLERGVEIITLVGALLFIVFLIMYVSHIRRRSFQQADEKFGEEERAAQSGLVAQEALAEEVPEARRDSKNV